MYHENVLVFKNIPYSYQKSSFLSLMMTMRLPLPYAFNYYFRDGIFHGLAFANFTDSKDASTVFCALLGREIDGRKLRVEFKEARPKETMLTRK